jgi:HEAT repeat protein
LAGAELTLAAALRDVDARRVEARSVAIRSLGPALLDELGLRPPVWWDRIDHPQRDAVVAALEQACTDKAPQNAALALIGLAELAAPSAHSYAREALESTQEDDAAMFLRECAVICLSLLGAAARDYLEEQQRQLGPSLSRDYLEDPAGATASPDARERAERVYRSMLVELRELLSDPRPDVRYQAGTALVEVGGTAVEHDLLAALDRERQASVRANLIAAISMLDPPSPAACDVLAAVLATPEGQGEVGWEAAMALTAARRPEGAPRLLAALARQSTRDRALEALAVLGPDGPPEIADAVRRYTSGWLTPVFTRVRAAYALARIEPERGSALLDRLAKHPRPAVREAVAEARVNLAKLAARSEPTDGDAYRRE